MNLTLISWLAYVNDFTDKDGKLAVDPSGPTADFHRYFYDAEGYDRHVLLSQGGPDDPRLVALTEFLRSRFRSHTVEPVAMHVSDVINVQEIKGKIEALLAKYADREVHVFVSPGTPAMQVAWYLAYLGSASRIKLLQTRRGENGKPPTLVPVDLERSQEVGSLVLRAATPESTPREGFFPPSLERIYERARKVADTDRVTALITGDSGTGKERLARFIHTTSARSSGPFVALNCASWRNESLLESRLFGYAKGAFTGADKAKPGAFEEAKGGTLFLDEIGDVGPAFQASLLRVLQEGVFSRVGETSERQTDVRVVAATHRDLAEACSGGSFRWDLYYRLSVAELQLPALGQWLAQDRTALLDFLLKDVSQDLHRPEPRLTPEVRERLLAYAWPGNIREMRNTVESLTIFFAEAAVEVNDLPARIRSASRHSQTLEDIKQNHVAAVYERTGGNKAEAARILDVAENTLRAYLKKSGRD